VSKWEDLPPEQKLSWLEKQREEIKRSIDLLRRFDALTVKWIKRMQGSAGEGKHK
jgi:hypothetical protein